MSGYNLGDEVVVSFDYEPRNWEGLIPKGDELYTMGAALRGKVGTVSSIDDPHFPVSAVFLNVEYVYNRRRKRETIYWGFSQDELYLLNSRGPLEEE